MSFILKWIYLQSAFIKPPSIKEQRPLILITEEREGMGRDISPQTPERITAVRTTAQEETGHAE